MHKDYKKMLPVWQMCEDAAAGERFVHAKGPDYLPKLKGEAPKDYLTRLKMTPWFGATWRTIIALRGMIFRTDPVMQVNDIFKENINNGGKSLIAFSKDVVLQVLKTSRAGILVDYPDTSEEQTQAGTFTARPYLELYNAVDILDWKLEIENGIEILTRVELKLGDEDVLILTLEADGYWQTKAKLDRNGRITDQKEPVQPKMNNAPLNFIPFQFVGADSLDPTITEPPLIDLITMNYHHYRQASSYERGCFLSGLPTLFLYTSDDPGIIYLGGATANRLKDNQAKAEFVEVKGEFKALLANLEQKERMMAVLGARMLEDSRKTAESEGTVARRQSGEESVLADIASTCEAGILKVLQWATEWLGEDPADVEFRLNREFVPAKLTSQEITALMSAYIQNGISYDTLFYNFQRAGMYPPNADKESERGAIGEL